MDRPSVEKWSGASTPLTSPSRAKIITGVDLISDALPSWLPMVLKY
jgi:hypothetical protein